MLIESTGEDMAAIDKTPRFTKEQHDIIEWFVNEVRREATEREMATGVSGDCYEAAIAAVRKRVQQARKSDSCDELEQAK